MTAEVKGRRPLKCWSSTHPISLPTFSHFDEGSAAHATDEELSQIHIDLFGEIGELARFVSRTSGVYTRSIIGEPYITRLPIIELGARRPSISLKRKTACLRSRGCCLLLQPSYPKSFHIVDWDRCAGPSRTRRGHIKPQRKNAYWLSEAIDLSEVGGILCQTNLQFRELYGGSYSKPAAFPRAL